MLSASLANLSQQHRSMVLIPFCCCWSSLWRGSFASAVYSMVVQVFLIRKRESCLFRDPCTYVYSGRAPMSDNIWLFLFCTDLFHSNHCYGSQFRRCWLPERWRRRIGWFPLWSPVHLFTFGTRFNKYVTRLFLYNLLHSHFPPLYDTWWWSDFLHSSLHQG